MNCAETGRLLNAYADGELTLDSSLSVDEHLQGCVRCRCSLESLQAASAALARHAPAPGAPHDLRRRVQESLRRGRRGRLAKMLASPLAIATPGIAALFLAAWLAFGVGMPPAAPESRVVYHISSSDTASAALRNLANHLGAAPETKVVVVAHNNGVDFLLRGQLDESGQPFAAAVREFRDRGVEFRICYNTLERRGIPASKVITEATVVPSGIAEIGRLQTREGYAYMRL